MIMEPNNILKIESLDGNWSDKDNIMLHACFQLFVDCIEKENLNEMTDWNHDDNYRYVKKEIDELYNWWKSRLEQEIREVVDPIWTENQHDNDTDMLIRLIKIRKYLWT